LLDHQVDERTDRPAPAGKFGRQRGIAGLNDPPTATRELGRTPQGRVYLFGRDSSAGHVVTKNLYIYTVSYTQIRWRELSLLFEEKGRATLVARLHILLPCSEEVHHEARYLISMHNGMTVRCDGEEWALDFGQELKIVDADTVSTHMPTAD
jgi:hypothetical protein